MKILHLSSVYAPQRVGGAERVVEMLAEASVAAGARVAVAHIAPQPGPAHCRNGVQVHPLRHRNPLRIEDSGRHPLLRQANKVATLFNVLTTADFGRVLDEVQPDIVHSHSMVELPPWAWGAAAAHGCAVVHTLHDYDLLCIRASLFKDGRHCHQHHRACSLFSSVKRAQHGHIGQVVGVSQAILDTHLQQGCFGHVPPSGRHVVWNPVALQAVPLPRPARHTGAPHTFGFIGRLVEEKGIHTLLDACRLLPPTGWRLRIAGQVGPQQQGLQQLLQGLPAELMGFVDPAQFLAGIDTLVVPSIWLEPFGLTILEAYAAGVPVIGAASAGVAEIVGAMATGALVPPGNAPALASRMLEDLHDGPMALDPIRRDALLARTRPAAVADAYQQVYGAALGRKPSPVLAV